MDAEADNTRLEETAKKLSNFICFSLYKSPDGIFDRFGVGIQKDILASLKEHRELLPPSKEEIISSLKGSCSVDILPKAALKLNSGGKRGPLGIKSKTKLSPETELENRRHVISEWVRVSFEKDRPIAGTGTTTRLTSFGSKLVEHFTDIYHAAKLINDGVVARIPSTAENRVDALHGVAEAALPDVNLNIPLYFVSVGIDLRSLTTGVLKATNMFMRYREENKIKRIAQRFRNFSAARLSQLAMETARSIERRFQWHLKYAADPDIFADNFALCCAERLVGNLVDEPNDLAEVERPSLLQHIQDWASPTSAPVSAVRGALSDEHLFYHCIAFGRHVKNDDYNTFRASFHWRDLGVQDAPGPPLLKEIFTNSLLYTNNLKVYKHARITNYACGFAQVSSGDNELSEREFTEDVTSEHRTKISMLDIAQSPMLECPIPTIEEQRDEDSISEAGAQNDFVLFHEIRITVRREQIVWPLNVEFEIDIHQIHRSSDDSFYSHPKKIRDGHISLKGKEGDRRNFFTRGAKRDDKKSEPGFCVRRGDVGNLFIIDLGICAGLGCRRSERPQHVIKFSEPARQVDIMHKGREYTLIYQLSEVPPGFPRVREYECYEPVPTSFNLGYTP